MYANNILPIVIKYNQIQNEHMVQHHDLSIRKLKLAALMQGVTLLLSNTN